MMDDYEAQRRMFLRGYPTEHINNPKAVEAYKKTMDGRMAYLSMQLNRLLEEFWDALKRVLG